MMDYLIVAIVGAAFIALGVYATRVIDRKCAKAAAEKAVAEAKTQTKD
jgi:hypothetical protein